MKVLPLPGGITSLQKCYLPMKHFDELGAYLRKYVSVKCKAGYCIVILNFVANLHDRYCHINAAVCSHVSSSTSTLFYDELKTSDITPRDGPVDAKTANISIVFDSLDKLVSWKKRNSVHVLADILEFYVLYIGIPNEVERYEILKGLLLSDEDTVVWSDILPTVRAAAVLTPGRVPAELKLICRQAKRMHLQRKHSGTGGKLDSSRWLNDFAHCAASLPVSSLLGGPGTLIHGSLTSSDNPMLSSIAGLQGVKERLIVSVREPLLHPEAFKRLGIRPPRGVLLFGPPGCAKTTLAQALASSDANHTITFLSSSAAELYSPFVGESEKTVVDLFRQARVGAPSIIFIDELDALFGSRDGMHKGGVQERVLAALLMEMDGVGHRLVAPSAQSSDGDQMMADLGGGEGKPTARSSTVQHEMELACQVTIIAATNRPDLIDDALLRPGRLDQLIYIPPPDEEARTAILSHYMEKMPIAEGDKGVLARELAQRTDLYSGADLKNLCKDAALKAISEEGFEVMEVEKKYFTAALQSMRSSLTPDMVMSYQKFCDNKIL